MTARTFATVSEAVGYAAAVCLHRGGIRKPKPIHGGPPPDDEAAIRVLQAMREAGCPHDSDEGRNIIAWAKAPDDVGVEVDSSVRAMLSIVLEQAGLVRKPPRLIPLGWRVHTRLDGTPWVTCVADPHPSDPSVLSGPKAAAISGALAGGLAVELLPSAANAAPLDAVRADALAAIGRGEPLGEVDKSIAARLRCSVRKAWTIRTRWQGETEGVAASVGG